MVPTSKILGIGSRPSNTCAKLHSFKCLLKAIHLKPKLGFTKRGLCHDLLSAWHITMLMSALYHLLLL